MNSENCPCIEAQKERFVNCGTPEILSFHCSSKGTHKRCTSCNNLVRTIESAVNICRKVALGEPDDQQILILKKIRECVIKQLGGELRMLSDRVSKLEKSITLAITAKAKEMKKAGEHVIVMASGEPDFDTPDHIKQAAIDAINSGFTKYTATAGIPELKKAISEKLLREKGLKYEPNEIIVTVGGKQALFNVFQAILNPGDEVILFRPYWVSYLEQIKLAGGVPVLIDALHGSFDHNELLSKITPATKAILINSPSNPSGEVIPEETIRFIAETAIEKDLFIISDEVYEKFVYEGNAVSPSILGEKVKNNLILVNAFSKTYSMTGWRVGFCASNPCIIQAMGLIQDHQSSNVCSIAQRAALAALTGAQDCVSEMVAEFKKRRDYMYERIVAIPNVVCSKPAGAFYLFPDVSALYSERVPDSMSFCSQLLEAEKVAIVPGIGFGVDSAIRLTYSASMEDIKEGLDRIERFISALK